MAGIKLLSHSISEYMSIYLQVSTPRLQHLVTCWLASFGVLSFALPTSSHVKLEGYGKFAGTVINSTLKGQPLNSTVEAWLGIDYATQPVGKARFKPVTWPAPFKGVRAATEYGKVCIQDPSYINPELQDEACLNMNVFRPVGTAKDAKLPTLIWIHGGAFVAGGWLNFDAPSFIASSKIPLMVVTFHYRVNSLGFLPSPLFEEEGLLNLGLCDQHLLLEFVQKHISSFGGDSDAVTLGGRSAGGHSTGIHYFHNYGVDENRPLFARAIHQSGSVTARAFPNATYPLYLNQFDTYMSYLGCQSDDNPSALACLRGANISDIRTISTQIYNDYEEPITWPFQPTQGGPMLEKFGSQSGYDGTFFHVPTITSTVTNEAKYYMRGDLETNQQFLDFMHNTSPELNSADMELMEHLYPDPATDPTSPYANSPNSTQYDRLAAAWSDYAYICPSQETAYRASSAGVPTWKARFDTNNSYPSWEGIPHTADTRYTWDDSTVQYPEISHVYHGYLSSFVAVGDPNTYRYPGSPVWENYVPGGNEAQYDLAEQLLIHLGATIMETDSIRREACSYWRDPERAPRLNK